MGGTRGGRTRVRWTGRVHDPRPLVRQVQSRHPRFGPAVTVDARVASVHRGDLRTRTSVLAIALQVAHLALVTDAFGALVLYRLGTSCRRRGIPLVSRLASHLSVMWAQVSIGDPVHLEPGVVIPHGKVVIAGFTVVGTRSVVGP